MARQTPWLRLVGCVLGGLLVGAVAGFAAGLLRPRPVPDYRARYVADH